MTDAEMYAMLSYFDTKNLATLITPATAVIQTIGLQDNVCPPHTNMAPYNNLPDGVEKQISYNALLMHATPSSWWNTYLQFFNDHVSAIETISTDCSSAAATYNLFGQSVSAPLRSQQVYIRNGKAFLQL